ncbi:MAG TPA: hypothetical protein VHP83_07335 [Aggregatilineaceae bacterium]|nr:hypothetical protein [Aggregatilineaceae bacterium]
MSTIVVLNSEYASLYFHTETKIVHHKLYSLLDSAHLREVLNEGTKLLGKYGAVKWLSDNRDIEAHSPEDTEWINTHWLPAAIDAGWKFWALVVPDDVAARMNMVEFVESFYAMGVRVMVFVEVEDAMRWLEKQDR